MSSCVLGLYIMNLVRRVFINKVFRILPSNNGTLTFRIPSKKCLSLGPRKGIMTQELV